TPASQPVPMPPVVPKAPQPEQKSKNQIKKDRRRLREEDMEEPAYSGALNATMAEAERMRREEMAAREKHHLLHHDTPGEAAEVEAKADEPTPVDASTPREDAPDDTSSPEQPVAPSNQPTVAPEVVAAPEPTPQPTTVADDEPKDERFAVPPLPPLPSEPVAAPEPSLPPAPATPPAPQPEPKAEVVTADPAQDAVELVSTPDRPFGSSSDEMLTFEETPIHTPSLADIDASTRGKAAEEAREAIDAALAAMPFNPAHKPLTGAGAVEVFDLHHAHESDASAPVSAPLAANPSLPPLPDFSTLPPLPTDTPPVPPMPVANEPDVSPQPAPTMTVPTISDIAPPLPTPPLSQPAANDPAQFRIPGQA
ncbi:MAG TPA: hypothetical protein VF597_03620, partial [Candidatus Saccharimonadales bacterium]